MQFRISVTSIVQSQHAGVLKTTDEGLLAILRELADENAREANVVETEAMVQASPARGTKPLPFNSRI